MKKLTIYKKFRQHHFARGAFMILRCGLPIIAAELIFIAISLSMMTSYDITRLCEYIHSIIEHIIMSLTLIVGGALLFDLAWHEHHD
ncbi:MAG: hypothetical protein HFE63_00740 [Clostridiales bacterium]|nr:hypothetical protein [Clostridiales bacterium]